MNENAKKIILLGACVLVAIAAYYYFGGNNNDGRADAIRADLLRIETQQRDIIKRLDTISKGLDTSIGITKGISNRVEEVAGLVGDVEGRISASKGRIIDSQLRIETGIGILQGIREREAKRNP